MRNHHGALRFFLKNVLRLLDPSKEGDPYLRDKYFAGRHHDLSQIENRIARRYMAWK